MPNKIGILLAMFCLALGAQETADVRLSADRPTKACESGAYQVVGEDALRCTPLDRVEILEAQRDFHHAAQELYKLQAEYLRQERKTQDLGKAMAELQRTAAEACKQLGRKFDVEKVLCGEVLPQAGGTDQ